MEQLKQQREQDGLRSRTIIESTKLNLNRTIFQADEGHNSKQTAVKYRSNFHLFLNHIKIYDLDVLLDLGKEAIQVLVIKYARSLRDNPRIVRDKKTGQNREEKYSYATVHSRIASVLYFFENNDIELNRRKIRRYYPPDESTNDDKLYTIEQIQTILSVCDLRTKAMIHLMFSSGVRIGALHTMRIGDLIPVTYQGQDLYKIRVYARTRDEYYSFVTPECRRTTIDPYLDYRRRCQEKLEDESPLFRKQFNRSLINNPYPLCHGAVMKVVDDAISKAGVKSKRIMRSHAFRKAYKSNCEQSGMKSINVEMLMGHDIGVSGHYYRPAESDILEDYMTHAADALTISSEYRLKKRNEELETGTAQKIAQQDEEITELKAEMHQMEIKNLEMWKKSLTITLQGMDRFDDDTQRLDIQNIISGYGRKGLDVSDLNQEFRRLKQKQVNNYRI